MRQKRTPSSREQERHAQSKPPRKRRGLLSGFLLMMLLLVLIAIGAVSVWLALFVKEISADLPTTDEIIKQKPSLASIIYDRDGEEIATLFQKNRVWVPYHSISPWLRKAVIAAEDATFYEHGGLDFSGILRALWIDIQKGGIHQGGSTITQQLARNLFLSREQTITRKAKEAILAMRIERLFSKEQILEMYLNTIYLGHGTWGIGAAAKQYFGKPAGSLTLAQASVIAGLIAAPERFSPFKHPERARERQRYVLQQMVDIGYINPQEMRRTLEQDLHLVQESKRKVGLLSSRAPYFTSYLLFKKLLPAYGTDQVYEGGLRVETTLDLELQQVAQEAVSKLDSEGALIALAPSTGEILAMVGGKDFAESKFNRAIQAFRQPGSAFKPIVYTAALQEGIRPIDRVLDAPLEFGNGWKPGNYSGEFHGEMTIANGLVHSYNAVAVRVANLTGIDKVITMARKLGITSPHLPHDLSVALGSASITPLELARCYCAFANGGYKVTPYAIQKIRTSEGQMLEQNGPSIVAAIDPQHAVTMRSLLRQVVLQGTGRRARIPEQYTFGKTGTTNGFIDAWFVGGAPGLVVAVYAGKDDHSKLGYKATGGKIAAPVWKEFVSQAIEILDLPSSFVGQESIDESVSICTETGFLATPQCSSLQLLLPKEEVPESSCPLHGGDFFLAEQDTNAPKLYLIDDDDTKMAKYSIEVAQAPNIPAEQRHGQVQKQDIPDDAVPSLQQDAYQSDPSPASQVEKRYQDLLQQYGLSN
ncbi:MAG: PBP1A family penicillin-binding protein [Synergistales bacterium]|nr:PBP1A family penicillin-binding protein [Synergistales bacterium]